MTTHLDPEDEATLEAHGWKRVKQFDNETRRWLLTDVWLLQSGEETEGPRPRVRIFRNSKLFQLHAEPVHGYGRAPVVPPGWIGPRFDDPAAVSRYLWMIGDGDTWTGVNVAIEDEWGC